MQNVAATKFKKHQLLAGCKAALPVDIEMDTYLGIDWPEVTTTAELLEARTKQLERRDETLELAHQKLMKTRNSSVRYWDRKMAARLRNPLDSGELLLIYNESLEDQWGGSYLLEELDGTELKRAYAASHIKRFYPRGRELAGIQQEEDENQQDDSETDSDEEVSED
ncbi:hypothetical protein PSTG_01185 [Puccinia striiformis f. sp. tritici PST-78]|uniref:Uncharacterized protein n=1 Tax=Puccinia striiformis f. sp. tritici PST-78 TaxID=1165861 RepID=A0A0L0W2L7_9BASI|nr:hypothetical protein PSTG_01185 [Puccinia striiformis f. sp. tritici PST-78]